MFQSCDPQRSPWINLFFPLKTSVTTIFVSLLFFPSSFFSPLVCLCISCQTIADVNDKEIRKRDQCSPN